MSNRGLEVISRSECERLLETHSFGRVVVKIGDELAALPVWYGVVESDMVFRTDPGTKPAAAVLHTRVAFEIDDKDECWSVLASGFAEEVRSPADHDALFERLATCWPTGERQRIVRIRTDRMSGRRLKSR